MNMPILAVAFAIYILGIAIVLVIRPTLMFGKGGSWKEFGIGRGSDHTIIPFWLFTIFWAFISYGLGLVIMSQFANIALSAFPESKTPGIYQGQQQPIVLQQPAVQQHNFIKPVSSSMGLQTNQPGYYVLQGNATGSPQYVYYGTEPPRAS